MDLMKPTPHTATTCEVRHLSKHYGTHAAVDNLTFTIPQGHVVGLIGPNGAGKTTAMKMLLGLVRPTSGEITLLDRTVGEPGWGTALQRVGSMIETPPIYDRLTARQNLRYQALAVRGRVDEKEVDELLEIVDLSKRGHDRPRSYSLGMRQRLGIAITLVGDPELVILDEPGNGLDPAGIMEIRRLMGRLPEMGTTVLVSSHQLAEMQQACDQLVVLANGRTIAQGATQEIIAGRSQHRFHVTVDPADADRARAALDTAKFVVIEQTGSSFVVAPPTEIGGREINRALVSADVYASRLDQPVVSLEDAFLELTTQPTTAHTTALEGASS